MDPKNRFESAEQTSPSQSKVFTVEFEDGAVISYPVIEDELGGEVFTVEFEDGAVISYPIADPNSLSSRW